jgi:neurotransmitter:Na+ symporter, NSS family
MSGREQWTSRSGFILATIGAAVGLGNIWRFSYVAGENGGAVFLILYLIFVLLIGLPIVIAELMLGRRAQGDAIAAFEQPGDTSIWCYLGWIGVIGAFLILSYYAVIAGWALKYFVGAATGTLWSTAEQGYGAYFKSFISHKGEPIGWQAAMLAASVYIVAGGVQKGIETVNRWLMPLLAMIIVALALFSLSLPGSSKGISFLFSPNWSVLGKPEVYIAALGQAFFSLGVGMAVFVTYGSYMPRSFPLPTSAAAIAFGDSLFAIVAGLAIFPAVFAFGIDPAAGPELAFITLPQVFLQMPSGALAGTVFFFLLTAAALTSMVSLLEVPVAMAVHRLKLQRWHATGIIGLVIFVLGLPSAMSFGLLEHIKFGRHGILDAIDAGVSNFVLPIGGVLIALFVGWRVAKNDALNESELGGTRLGVAWYWVLRAIAPLAILAILLESASTL